VNTAGSGCLHPVQVVVGLAAVAGRSDDSAGPDHRKPTAHGYVINAAKPRLTVRKRPGRHLEAQLAEGAVDVEEPAPAAREVGSLEGVIPVATPDEVAVRQLGEEVAQAGRSPFGLGAGPPNGVVIVV
jgi:hypothetical protein